MAAALLELLQDKDAPYADAPEPVDMPAPFIALRSDVGLPELPYITLLAFNTDGLSYAYMLFYEGRLAGELLGAVDVAE